MNGMHISKTQKEKLLQSPKANSSLDPLDSFGLFDPLLTFTLGEEDMKDDVFQNTSFETENNNNMNLLNDEINIDEWLEETDSSEKKDTEGEVNPKKRKIEEVEVDNLEVKQPTTKKVDLNEDKKVDLNEDKKVDVKKEEKPKSPSTGLWVNIKSGEVETDWKSEDAPSSNHMWMTYDEFVEFKNAGKRTASSKYTDKETGIDYFSKDKVKWFSDKEMTKEVDAKEVPVDRLLDRTRKDRTNSSIELYDVSTYNDQKNNEEVGDCMEHDHVVAGESIKRRVDKEANDGFEIDVPDRTESFNGKGKDKGEDWAYDNAPSIEIRGNSHDEGWDHKDYSPTWGYRQKNEDKLVDSKNVETHKMQRPDMDAEIPGAAFTRDVDTMLTNTGVKNRDKKLKEVGAYRKLYKNNIKLGNFSLKSPAFRIISGDPLGKKKDGGLTWQKDEKLSQGEVTDEMLRGHIRSRLSKPNKN